MPDELSHQPHDRFVRRLLTDLDHVRELVRWQLPTEVLAELNLETIERTQQSFVSKTLRDNLSDLVFHVQLSGGGESLVVLLFEHKSQPDRMTAFQVLRYVMEIYDERIRNSLPLRAVIPMVLYHGPRPWQVARSLRDLVDVPSALQQFVPDFDLFLMDLSQHSDEELKQESLFFLHMQLLKYIQRDDLAEHLPDILTLFRKLTEPSTALEQFETILRYLMSGTDRISRDQLQNIVSKTIQAPGESLMPTIAEQLRQEGIEQGIEQGREEGREQGELIGRILTLEGILGRELSNRDKLSALSLENLKKRADQLTNEVVE